MANREERPAGSGKVTALISGILIGILVLALGFYGAVAATQFGKTDKKPDETTTEPTTPSETPEPSSEEPEPSTEEPDPYRKIEAVSSGRLVAIEEDYDTEVHEFGTWTDSEADGNNRPAMIRPIEEMFADIPDDPVTFYCAEPGTKQVAITFQANIETGYTEDVLDILEEQGIKSTFFISRYYAQTMSQSVGRMIHDGHEIGNASNSAPDGGIASQPLNVQMEDALKMQDFMEANFDYTPRKYLFNGGFYSEASVRLMSEMGFQVCFCSCNYEDYYVNREYDSAATLEMLKSKLHDGCVYCFHMTNKITVSILEELIKYIRAQGYEIVQLPYK